MSRHEQQQSTTHQPTHHSQREGPGLSTQHRSNHQAPTQTASSSPPVGFRLVSALFATTGLLLLAGAAVLFKTASTVSAVFGPTGAAVLAIPVASWAFGLTTLITGYGSWRFRSSGRKLGLFVSGSATVGSLFLLVAAGPAGLPGLALNGGAGWYLSDNNEAYAR